MFKRVCNYSFWFSLVLSIFVLIRYSSLPVIELPFNIERLFIKPDYSDGIFFNLSIGFVVSSIFYLMIVYYPERIRKEKITKIVLYELSTVCTDAMILIVNIYKNVCYESEWNYKHIEDDKMFFDKDFYNRIQRFDVNKTADTLLCHKEEPYNTITWNEKLFNDFEEYITRIDAILNRYLFFLDDEMIDCILAFQRNMFITTYLGLPSNEIGLLYRGKDGKKYLDKISLHVLINDKSGRKTPIFSANEVCDNREVLISYVNSLIELREFCYKYEGFKKNIAVKQLCEEERGQCGVAIA